MILVIYLVLINIAAFVIYGVDKRKAGRHERRISERCLIIFAAVGGAAGALLGMVVFHHKTRKRKFYITVPVLFALLIAFCSFCLYQNYHIVVTEYTYEAPGYEGPEYTIVQVSDLHNGLFGSGQKRLLSLIEEQSPDLIVVTGDAVDSTFTCYSFAEDFFEGAVKIAPVYYITGNHEAWLGGEKYDSYLKDITGLGVIFADGQKYALDGIEIIGTLNESCEGVPLFDEKDGTLKILLAHDPARYEEYEATGADIVFTGHVHGGQIIIPGKGGLVSPDFSFFPDLYEGEHRFGDLTMYISRGLGNSVLPVRINNYPELVVVTIKGD
ncbi:MAG: DUF1294 domain-containing protein [Clostridiales bacterium]|nr:DUF1294 domain-containing protein [Clostridiales bacterium]